MKQSITHIALVVRDYDEAIEFYTGKCYLAELKRLLQMARDENQKDW